MPTTAYLANAAGSPQRLACALMWQELDRQAFRAGMHPHDLPVRVAEPGIVIVSPQGAQPREASFFGVQRALGDLPNDAGSPAVHAGLAAKHALRAPHPRNSHSHVQVGDTFALPLLETLPRKRTVDAILVGGPFDVARPRSVPWGTPGVRVILSAPRSATLEVALGDLIPQSTPPSPERAVAWQARHLHAQAASALDRKVAEARGGRGWDRGLLALCAIRNAILGMATPPAESRTPEAAEALLLKAHLRGLDGLRDAVARPGGFVAMRDRLLELIEDERAPVAARAREIARASDLRRRGARAGRRPDAV